MSTYYLNRNRLKHSYVLRLWESNAPQHNGWYCRLEQVDGRSRATRKAAVRVARNFRSNPECSVRLNSLSALPEALDTCKAELARHLRRRIEDDRQKLASLSTLTTDNISKPNNDEQL